MIKYDNFDFGKKVQKFDVEYCDSTYKADGLSVSCPIFVEYEKLNNIMLDIIYNYCLNNNGLKIKFVFADTKHISLLINELYALNFSLSINDMLTPNMVLSEFGMKKKNVLKKARKLGKEYRVIFDSIRFCQGGIRVTLYNTLTKDTEVLKMSKK